MLFASADGATVSIAASMTGTSSIRRGSIRSLPAAMRDVSKRSSMSCVCRRALRSIRSSAFESDASSRRLARKIIVQPKITPSGVRSSCVTIARKSSLARFAFSASNLPACARASKRSRSSTARLRAASM